MGEEAVTKELTQLHFQNTFKPIYSSTLSKQEMGQVIKLHLFLKLKCDATIKERMVTGGNKQHGYIPKEEAAAPTASLELMMLTSVIDAQEGYNVAIADIPNAFIQTHLTQDDDKVVMQLHGPLVILLVDLAPEVYGLYLKINKNRLPVFYIHVLNALYGLIKVALLYYQHFVATIPKWDCQS